MRHVYKEVRHLFNRAWVMGVLAVLILAACTSSTPVQPEAAEPPESAAPGCTVKIGVVTSLTGKDTERAVEVVRGYEMAQDDINAAGGIGGSCPVELVIKDDASQSSRGEAMVKELVEENNVPIILGAFSSEITVKLVPVASRYRVPFLAHNATSFLVTDLGYEWVFRTQPSSWNVIGKFMKYVLTLPLGEKPTMAIVYEDTVSGRGFAVTVISYAKEAGISLVVSESFRLSTPDFRPILRRVKNAAPDIVYFAASGFDDALLLMKQCQELDINPKVYLSNGGAFNSSQFLKNATYADYFLSAVPWASSVDRRDEASGQTTQQFVQRFTERYGNPPGYRSVNAYVNIYIAKQAIEQAAVPLPVNESDIKSVRMKIRDALRDLNIEHTLWGPIKYDASGQRTQPPLIVQTIGGKLEVIYPEADKIRDLIFPAPTWAER